MKNYFLLLSLVFLNICFAQQFEKKWEKVMDLEAEGKTKSANEAVSKIFRKASRKKNEPELVKAILFQSKYALILNEEAQRNFFKNLDKIIPETSKNTQAIFHFIYAKSLNDYYKVNQYQINQRTATDSIYDNDFKTWSKNTFEKEIVRHYELSLEPEESLQKTPLRNYQTLIIKNNAITNDSRSLYDFLANEYIEYCLSSNNFYRYDKKLKTDNKKLIRSLSGNTDEFLSTDLDTLPENPRKILSLYQKIEKEYQRDSNTFWKEYTSLARLHFIFSELFDRKDLREMEMQAFEKCVKDFKDIYCMEEAKLFVIQKYLGQASRKENPDCLKKALLLSDEIQKSSNVIEHIKQAKEARSFITKKIITVTYEPTVIANRTNRVLINYRNIDKVYGSVYKDDEDFSYLKSTNEKENDSLFVALLKRKKPYKIFERNIPKHDDFFSYSTEILYPELEPGSYWIVFRNENGSLNADSPLGYEKVKATNLVIQSFIDRDLKHHILVLNRTSGKPIENADVVLSGLHLKTNKEGKAIYQLDSQKSDTYKNFYCAYEKDTLQYENFHYPKTQQKNTKLTENARISILTDRSIYRPGQKVFFKVIAAYRDSEENTTVIANREVKVVVQNANGDNVYETSLKTNEFGSASDEFTLPKTGLTGSYSIQVTNNPFRLENYDDYFERSLVFNVEEYKRPNFEINFNPVKSSYAINQKVTVKGNAKALAGSSISEGKVTYRIVRSTSYGLFNFYGNIRDNTQIAHGETSTDAQGNFAISFIAKPNEMSDKKGLPIFSYSVYADVTDNSGETRSAQTTVNVGYHTLKLEAQIANSVKNTEKPEIILNSLNLNNNFTAVSGELKIYKLQAPERVLTNRKLQRPGTQTIPKEEFIKLFPYEPYENENEKDNWQKGATVFSASVNTKKNPKIILKELKNWKSGVYEMIFTAKDTLGNEVEKKQSFRILNDKDVYLADNQLFNYEVTNKNPKADGFILLKMMTAAPSLYINTEAYDQGLIYFSSTTHLDNGTAYIKVPIENTFKEEVKLNMDFILDNTHSTYEIVVPLLEIEERLEFETLVMRNKIEPGQNETWSFSVKNEIKTGVQAEVLASMYDTALDQFSQSYWTPFLITKSYPYFRPYPKESSEFTADQFDIRNLNPYESNTTNETVSDKFNWYGFNINHDKKDYSGYSGSVVLKNKIRPKPKKRESFTVNGVVYEGGLPLPGAAVTIKGTTIGTQTDMDGNYSIKVKPNDILVYSFIGMRELTTTVTEYATIDISMASESTALENVVITARGIRKEPRNGDEVFPAKELTQAANPNIADNFYMVGNQTHIVLRGNRSISGKNDALVVIDGVISDARILQEMDPETILSTEILKGTQAAALYGDQGVNGVIVVTTKKALNELNQVKARKNLSETAFFYPNLQTDKNGKISFSFTSPEALTRWRLRMLAHTKKAVSGYYENTIITQKDFMMTPNFPRYFREKDTVYISVKLANMTHEAKAGIATLQLFDAVTMETIDSKLSNRDNIKNFTITAKGNSAVTWRIVIPEGLQGIQYKVLAKSGNFTDGEENIIPVVTNSMLVTESIPLWVRENSKKEYVFENMKNNNSSTLRNHLLTLEYTSNPTWLAIQSLPYLMEYEHECAEQTFARFYGNALATTIINSNPKLAAVFESWRRDGNLTSKLEQNEELKSVILAETPWLLDAKSDEEKKKSLALLLDLNKMKISLTETFQKLKAKQTSSGGFAWFNGMEENSYITNHIMAGLGHLEKLKISTEISDKFEGISETAIPFMDSKFVELHRKRMEKQKDPSKLIWQQPYSELHYLYARSFYLEAYPLSALVNQTTKIYLEQCKKNWLTYSLYEKGMAALALNRFGETKTAKDILTHLKETAADNEDSGMYWLENKPGWYWYQSPIETQALLIEAVAEIENDTKSADAMKVWLLKSRQNTNWPSTKASTEAVYALLLQGSDWLSVKDNTVMKLGAEEIATKKMKETEKEAETGYFKMTWKADEIKKEMATLSIENKSKVPGYGGYFWQYFEDLDNIKTFKGGPMSVEKELYLNKNTDNGKQLQRITSKNPLRIGDLVTVRLVIKVTENMEYIHLKDMRAAGFEPVDVISKHNWKNGLSYYQSTKDLATHFFFDQINKGTYVLEYDVRVNNKGDFSNGITTIQSMYAPEFTSHTKGIRISVNE